MSIWCLNLNNKFFTLALERGKSLQNSSTSQPRQRWAFTWFELKKQAVISHSDTEVDADSGSRSLNNTERGTGNRYWDAGNYSTGESERSPVEIIH